MNCNNVFFDPSFFLTGNGYRVDPHFETICDFSAWSYISLPSNASETNQSWLKSTRTRFTGINLGDGGLNDIGNATPWTPQFGGGYYAGPGNVISFFPSGPDDVDIYQEDPGGPNTQDAERFRHMFDRMGATTPTANTIWSAGSFTTAYKWFSIHGQVDGDQNSRYFMFIPKGWVLEASAPVLATVRVHSTGYHIYYKSANFGENPTYTTPTTYGMVSYCDGSYYRGSISHQMSRSGGYPRHLPFLVDFTNNRFVFCSWPNVVDDAISKDLIFSGVFSCWDTFNFWDLPATTQFNGLKYSPLNNGITAPVPLLTNAG